MAVPGARLQGSTGSGSAAAAVNAAPTPVPAAPAKSSPRPSKARRSSRPLPAVSGAGDTSLFCLLVMLLVMDSSFEAWRPPEHLQGRRIPTRHHTMFSAPFHPALRGNRLPAQSNMNDVDGSPPPCWFVLVCL